MSNHPKVVLKYWANARLHENQDRATDRTEIPTREGYNMTSKALLENPAGAYYTQSLQVRRAETLFILHFQWITALEERSWNLPGISPLKP